MNEKMEESLFKCQGPVTVVGETICEATNPSASAWVLCLPIETDLIRWGIITNGEDYKLVMYYDNEWRTSESIQRVLSILFVDKHLADLASLDHTVSENMKRKVDDACKAFSNSL